MGFVRKIIFLIPLFIVVFVAVLYFFTIPYGENIIRSIVENKIGTSLGLQVHIGSFETNLLSRVQISDVSITQVSGNEKLPFVSVNYARVEYRLWRLLSLNPYIDHVVIDSLSVSVARDSSGYRLPVSRGKKKQNETQKPLDFGIQLALLDLRNSSVTYDDYTLPLHASAGNVTVNIREQNNSIYIFKLDASAWEIIYRAQPVSIDNLSISGVLSDDEISIDHFELASPDLRCSLQSTVDMSESPLHINGNARIQGNISSVVEIFHEKIPERVYPQKGSMETVIEFTGTIHDPHVTMSIVVNDVEFKDTSLDILTVEADYHNRILNLHKIYLELLDGTLSGKGTVAADSLLNHDLSLEVSEISFKSIWELVYKETSPYGGYINGSLETNGPLKIPHKLSSSAHLSFEKVTHQSQQFMDFETDIIYKDGLFDLVFKQSTTELRAGITLAGDEIQGNFQFHTTNPEVLTGFAKILELHGSIDIKGALSGNLQNPSITADVKCQNLRFHGFPLDSLNGVVIYENNRVLLKEVAFSGNLETVDSLTYPFRNS